MSGTQRCACRGWRTGVLHLNQREYDYVSNCSHFRVIFFFYDGDSWRKLRHWNLQWALFSGFNMQHFCKQKLFAPHMKKLFIKGVERSRISVSGRIISISMLQFSADILDRQLVVKTNKQMIFYSDKHFPKWHQYKNIEARSVEKMFSKWSDLELIDYNAYVLYKMVSVQEHAQHWAFNFNRL